MDVLLLSARTSTYDLHARDDGFAYHFSQAGGGLWQGDVLLSAGCLHVNHRCLVRFRLQASGFRLQASGFRLQASGFRPTTPQTPKPNPCTSRLPACYRITKKLSTNPKPGVAHPQEMTFPRKSERARANVRRASFAARTWPRPSRQDTRAH